MALVLGSRVDDGNMSIADDVGVAAFGAIEAVVARAAVQRVVAIIAIERVIAVIADDPDTAGEFVLQQTVERIADDIATNKEEFNISKIYFQQKKNILSTNI